MLVGLVVLIFEVGHAISISERDALRCKEAEIQEALQNLAMSPVLAEIMAELQAGRTENLMAADGLRLSARYAAVLRRMQDRFKDHRLGHLEANANMLRVTWRTVPLHELLGQDIEALQPAFVEAVLDEAPSDPPR